MKLNEIARPSYMGYRVVEKRDGKYYSLYSKEEIPLKIGQETVDPKGFYLGTTREFATDYYTGLTDYDDAILTYEYRPEDVIKGDPTSPNSEIIVRRAKLLEIS